MPEAKVLGRWKKQKCSAPSGVPGRKVACELAVSTNFVDPRHVIIALHLCYRACDTDAVANIHGVPLAATPTNEGPDDAGRRQSYQDCWGQKPLLPRTHVPETSLFLLAHHGRSAI